MLWGYWGSSSGEGETDGARKGKGPCAVVSQKMKGKTISRTHAPRGEASLGKEVCESALVMGGKVQNVGPGAGRWGKGKWHQFILLTSCSVTSEPSE